MYFYKFSPTNRIQKNALVKKISRHAIHDYVPFRDFDILDKCEG